MKGKSSRKKRLADIADIKVYMFVGDLGRSGYYRIIEPFRALKNMGVNVQLIGTLQQQYIEDGNIFVFQRDAHPFMLNLCWFLRQQKKALIFDMDELLTEIPPQRPDFYYLWSPEVNRLRKMLLVNATMITVPGEDLQREMQAYNTRVEVIPSYIPQKFIDPKSRPYSNVEKRDNPVGNGIVIGWIGTYGDVHDFLPVKESLESLLMSNNHLFLAANEFVLDLVNIPESRKIKISHEVFSNYFSFLDKIDIGLAPMVESRFNRCKTGLEILEYGAKKIPVIASNTSSHRSLYKAGAPILIAETVEDWRRHLKTLIENRDLRIEKGTALQHFIIEHGILEKHINKYVKLFKQVIKVVKNQ